MDGVELFRATMLQAFAQHFSQQRMKPIPRLAVGAFHRQNEDIVLLDAREQRRRLCKRRRAAQQRRA